MPTSQYLYGFESQVDQVLYSWGQVGAAIRAAKEGLADADDQLRIYQQAVARDLSVAFYDVLLAKEMLADRPARTWNRSSATWRRPGRNTKPGPPPTIDVLAAEVEVQNARPGVIRSENLILTAQERLRFLLGLEGQPVDADGSAGAPRWAPIPRFEAESWIWRSRTGRISGKLEHQENIDREAGEDLLRRQQAAGGSCAAGLAIASMSIGMGQRRRAGLDQAGIYMTFPGLGRGPHQGQGLMQAQSDLATLQIQRAQLKGMQHLAAGSRRHGRGARRAGEVAQALSGTVTQAEKLLVFMAEKGFEFGVKTKLDVDDAQLNLLRGARSTWPGPAATTWRRASAWNGSPAGSPRSQIHHKGTKTTRAT